MLEEVGKRPRGDPAPLFHFARADRHERRVQQDMTIEISQGDGTAAELLAVTDRILSQSALALGRAVSGLGELDEAQAGEKAKAALQAVKDFRNAYQIAMDERTRVDKLRRQVAGDAGSGALDLETARDEIGRRLACLRNAGGGG